MRGRMGLNKKAPIKVEFGIRGGVWVHTLFGTRVRMGLNKRAPIPSCTQPSDKCERTGLNKRAPVPARHLRKRLGYHFSTWRFAD